MGKTGKAGKIGKAEKPGNAEKMNKLKKIAFAIAALNEERNIARCIDSIMKNNYNNQEIIVVDGGSKDRTARIAKERGAVVLKESGENRCPANAWNQAINHTDAELICILGADFFIPPDFAEKTAKAFNNPKVACVYTEVRTDEETLIEKIVSCFGMSMHPNVFRRDIALKIGGLPTIGYGEDRIFAVRFSKYADEKGMQVKYLRDTYYSGHAVQTISALYKQGKWYGRTSLLFLKEFYRECGFSKALKEAFSVNFKMGYFVLLALSLLLLRTSLFYYFFATFVAIALATVLKNVGRPYHALKIFTNLISGFGFFIGFFSYVLGLNKTRGRG